MAPTSLSMGMAPPAASSVSTCVALDCEYVGGGAEGRTDLLARVSLVDVNGRVLYDVRVRPREKVTDWRTAVSGMRPGHLANAVEFDDARTTVLQLIDGKVVVGHALHNDFRVLELQHPKNLVRDTAKFKYLRNMARAAGVTGTPSLKVLAEIGLGMRVQIGEHDSVQDARTAMSLYQLYKKWDKPNKGKRAAAK